MQITFGNLLLLTLLHRKKANRNRHRMTAKLSFFSLRSREKENKKKKRQRNGRDPIEQPDKSCYQVKGFSGFIGADGFDLLRCGKGSFMGSSGQGHAYVFNCLVVRKQRTTGNIHDQENVSFFFGILGNRDAEIGDTGYRTIKSKVQVG